MIGKVVILMGSERDLDFSREIAKYLKLLGVTYEFRVASAHKTPEKVLEIIKEFEDKKIVYVTVAGRSASCAFVVRLQLNRLLLPLTVKNLRRRYLLLTQGAQRNRVGCNN